MRMVPAVAVQEAINNLENSLDQTTLQDDWRITDKYLINVLLAVEKLSVSDYMKRFPCLRVKDAKSLV